MQHLDVLEGLRRQGFPNEEVAERRYEIMQKFIRKICNFELKRNLALMNTQEQYVEAPSTVEALRMCRLSRSKNYPAPPQQQQPPLTANQQNPVAAVPQPEPNAKQPPQQPAAYR